MAGGRTSSALDAAARTGDAVKRRPPALDDADSRARLVEIQRARLLAAAVNVLDERGYERTTVSHITARARVSRRTFYELFANRDQCVAALLNETAARVQDELDRAGVRSLPWRERMREGLWLILCFLRREPTLAHVLVVDALRGGNEVLAARDRIVQRLVAAVDEGRVEDARGLSCSRMTAEGVVGATLAIVHSRLARAGEGPALTELSSELLAMIVLPYRGAAAARREQTRPAPSPPDLASHPAERQLAPLDPLARLPMRLTYRTARVLDGVARHPGASNRQISDHAGIADQGQVSKLLARLQRLGLLDNEGGGHVKGAPNAWTLTAAGELVAREISLHGDAAEGRRAA
ncbi:MAG TPA: TetR family transcriptional regulator [Solirubrobacteraceae bacterium]|nr:TetR family transcriptional regulator [Solirubrobacteraceae bacterium]